MFGVHEVVEDGLTVAGLSRDLELTAEQARRARLLARLDRVAGGVRLSPVTGRRYVLTGEGVKSVGVNTQVGLLQQQLPTNGVHTMTPKPKYKQPTKAQLTKAAKMRREGAGWTEVNEAFPNLRTRSSTEWRVLLESAGFDKFGRKGGKGKSLAKGAGGAGDPNLGASARA